MFKTLLRPWRNREDMRMDDLVDAAAEIIPRLADSPDYGRATAIPDKRTIRYYIQQGLVDRPHGSAGTAALYGYRHLLQLTAVKVLQGQYMPMGRIRRAIGRLKDRELEDQLRAWAATPRQMWVESPIDWQERRLRSWAGGFAELARVARSGAPTDCAEGSISRSADTEPEAFDRSGDGEGAHEETQPTGGPAIFAPSVRRAGAEDGAPPTSEDSAGDSRVWRRYELHPGVELHVREGVEFPARASFPSTLASRLRAILSSRARTSSR